MNRRSFFAAISSFLVAPKPTEDLLYFASKLQRVTLTSNETFTFVPNDKPISLRIVQDKANVVVWPANIKWSS